MEGNTIFYGGSAVVEKELLGNARSRSLSSDSEDFGLTIDLDSDYFDNDLNNSSHEIRDDDDDEQSIGCDENETSVNFFIKVENAEKLMKKSKRPKKTDKKSKLEHESCGQPKRRHTIESRDKKSEIGKQVFPSKICTRCDFKAELIKDLHEHVQSSHKAKSFDCSDCPFKAKTKFQLSKHTEYHSLGNATYQCSVCTFGSHFKKQHNNHMQVHSKDSNFSKKAQPVKLFQCPLCPVAKPYLATLQHFKIHAKEHQDLKNIILCPLCGMKVKNSFFHKHSKHHITLKPEKIKWKNKNGENGQKIEGEDKNRSDEVCNVSIEKEVDNDTVKVV